MSNESVRNLLNTLDRIAEGQQLAAEALEKDVIRAAAKGAKKASDMSPADFHAPESPPVERHPMPKKSITGKGSLIDKSPKLNPVKKA